MSRTPDVELVLRDYFADDGGSAPDYVLDVVEERVRRQPQRHSWRLLWRLPAMNRPLTLLAVTAAVVLVAIIGANLFPGVSGPGGPTAAPTPSPIQATGEPGETFFLGPAELRSGALTAGPYLENPFDDDPSLAVIGEYPDGWIGIPPIGVTGPNGTDGPDGIGVAFLRAEGLFEDPCHWNVNGTGLLDQPGDVDVGPEVIDLVNALRASSAYTVPDPPSMVSFGADVLGYELEVQLPADLNLETCDLEAGTLAHRYIVFSGKYGSLYAQGDGNRWHLFIIDVRGTRVIVNIPYFEETPAADQQAAQAIIESLDFGP
jgi:hypothetical protein